VRAIFLFLLIMMSATAGASISVEIDLTAQRAWLLQDGQPIYETPISSGRGRHATRTGSFTVTEKSKDHHSSLYGRIVDRGGRTLVVDGDSRMPRPPGAKFVGAPMKYFVRFDGGTGFHAGHLPGYAASHGCVRMPSGKAALFFNIVEVGTPVRVFGKAPAGPAPRPKSKPAATPFPFATPVPAQPKKSWWPFRRAEPAPRPPAAETPRYQANNLGKKASRTR
jgi:hypothetical protein